MEKQKEQWESMALIFVGRASDIVLQGQGKILGSPGDPGEVGYKPRGQDK